MTKQAERFCLPPAAAATSRRFDVTSVIYRLTIYPGTPTDKYHGKVSLATDEIGISNAVGRVLVLNNTLASRVHLELEQHGAWVLGPEF